MTDDELNKCCTEVARQIILETYDKYKIDTDLKLSIAVCDLSLFIYTKIRAYKAAVKHKQALENRVNNSVMSILQEMMGTCMRSVDCTKQPFVSYFAQLRLDLNSLYEINKNIDLKASGKECENDCCVCDRCRCECEVDD